MKKHFSTILLVVVLLVGLSLVLYPSVADYVNSRNQSRAIVDYNRAVQDMTGEDYTHMWQEAREFNAMLAQHPNRFMMEQEQLDWYQTLMDASGLGIIGYIEIPLQNLKLPIYHGTDEAVLQIAVGHVEGSSLPTGDVGTHCVLSGHRGLPSAKLFTNLDEVVEGDTFLLHVLDEVFTYQVDQILTVLPHEVEALEIDPEQDYCTLVTCTPYGINTHRLLVRGHRIETVVEEVKTAVAVSSNAQQISFPLVAAAVGVPLLLIALIGMAIFTRKR